MIKIVKNFLEYLLAFLLIVSTNSVYFKQVGGMPLLPLTVIAILIALILLNVKVLGFTKRDFEFVLLYLLLLFLTFIPTFLYSKDTVFSWIRNLLLTLPLLIFLSNIYIRERRLHLLIEKYQKLVISLAAISLFFWIFGSLLHLIHPNDARLISWGGYRQVSSYFGVYFETQKIDILQLKGQWRNDGIFVEGPMYSLIISLSWLYELFFNRGKKLFRTVILGLTLFSIFSTTGFIVLATSLFVKLVETFKRSFIVFISGLMTIPMGLYLGMKSISIVFANKTKTGSGVIRLDDFRAGVEAWKEHLILGHGYGNRLAIIKHMNMSIRSNTGYSNGLLEILSHGGIVLFLLYFLPMIVLLLNKRIKLTYKYLILIWFAIIFATVSHTLPIFYMVVGISYAYLINIKESSTEELPLY